MALAFILSSTARGQDVDLVNRDGFTRLALEYERQVAWSNLPEALGSLGPHAHAWMVTFPRMFWQHTTESREASLLGFARLIVLAMKHGLHLPGRENARVNLENAYVRDLKRLAVMTSTEQVPDAVLALKMYAEAGDDHGWVPLRPAAWRAIDRVVEGVGAFTTDPARDVELVRVDLRTLAVLGTAAARAYLGRARADQRRRVRSAARNLTAPPKCGPSLSNI